MKKNTTSRSTIKITAVAYVIAALAIVALVNACNKNRKCDHVAPAPVEEQAQQNTSKVVPATQGKPLTSVLTVAMIRPSDDGTTDIMFNENQQIFTINDASIIAALKNALGNNTPVQVTFNPWKASISRVNIPTAQELNASATREVLEGASTATKINLNTLDANTIDNADAPAGIAPINTTSPGLENVIPNFETAQMMFNYIAHQCCALPGPYGVDHCISFQYCQDGCYARAHKMCYVINKKYRYGTKKIFSFANAGTDKLCVQGQKWGGCCINWWYHVAPLVTVQTPTGPKAYVFDPAMFDQPVLLSVWLHAQENPACLPAGKTAHVTMINVQPTASYTPSGSSGTVFSTDPTYSSTNSTLVSYGPLTTCP